MTYVNEVCAVTWLSMSVVISNKVKPGIIKTRAPTLSYIFPVTTDIAPLIMAPGNMTRPERNADKCNTFLNVYRY